MSVACLISCQLPNLQTSSSSKFFPVASSNKDHTKSVAKDSFRLNVKSPDNPLNLLQNSTTTANIAEQQEWSLVSSNRLGLQAIIQDSDDTLIKQRVTLARLVKGVYEIEYRRLQGISYEKSPPARLWWESVHFDLIDEFENEEDEEQQQQSDRGIDVAVYRRKSSETSSRSLLSRRVVVAIRGTLPSMDDGWHNAHGSLQCLHLTPRFRRILKIVKTLVETHGSDEVCITGHSLGAALGLLVARTLATEEGILIESHLFNPVYSYTWIPTSEEILENEGLWRTVRTVRCAAVAGLASIFINNESRKKIASEYSQLQEWTPHMYINTGDPFCRGYWEYFTNHERLARNGALGAYIAYMAAPFSGRGLLTTGLGSKPSHLIPSAVLHVCEGELPTIWSGAYVSDQNQYSSHNLGRWMMEDMPISTREVRLSSW